jgi:hypothetical protein
MKPEHVGYIKQLSFPVKHLFPINLLANLLAHMVKRCQNVPSHHAKRWRKHRVKEL